MVKNGGKAYTIGTLHNNWPMSAMHHNASSVPIV